MYQTLTSSDGIKLAYYVDNFTDPWKTPETILLLHSMMGSAQRFYSWMPALTAKYRVVRMDMRGHGNSEIPAAEKELSMDRLVKDALEVLNELGIEATHIVANSAGGYVAQHLAMNHPDRVKSLVLYGSTPGLAQSSTNTWIPRIRNEGFEQFLRVTISDRFHPDYSDPDMVEWFLQDVVKNNDPEFICRWLEFASPLEWGQELTRVQCPTLIVRPGSETVGTASVYDVMLEKIPDVEMITYTDMPHNIADFRAESCVNDALSFLSRRFPKALPSR
ncbi:MAG: alpha/beta hydrolase [Pusillimonas sp.]